MAQVNAFAAKFVTGEEAAKIKIFIQKTGSRKFFRAVRNNYFLFVTRLYGKRVPKLWSTQSKTLRSYSEKDDRITIFSASKSLIFQELGTRPHRIRPRNEGGVLAWNSGGGGVRFRRAPNRFARAVEHPGIKATRIVGRTVTAGYTVFMKTQLFKMVEASLGGKVEKKVGGVRESKWDAQASRRIRRSGRRKLRGGFGG